MSLVDKVLERLLHDVNKFLILVETHRDDVVEFVFEICPQHIVSLFTVSYITVQ